MRTDVLFDRSTGRGEDFAFDNSAEAHVTLTKLFCACSSRGDRLDGDAACILRSLSAVFLQITNVSVYGVKVRNQCGPQQ